MNIAFAIIGLGVIILVHELGHFLVSLALKMRPRKFYIGFPPAVVKTTRGGIEYGIGAIPLGGFVKIPGMHRPIAKDATSAFAAAVTEAPWLQPTVTRLEAALATDDHGAARQELEALADLVQGKTLSPAAAKTAERGLTDLADGLGPDAYWRAATWRRVAAIAAGPAFNVIFALVVFAVLFLTVGGKATTTVDEVTPGSPAAQAGLMPGDDLIAIGGLRVAADSDVPAIVKATAGKPVSIVVRRGAEQVVLGPVSPRSIDGALRLGFTREAAKLTPTEAIQESGRVVGLVTRDVVVSIGHLVTGEGREDISSPVGIVQASSDAADQGADSFLWVLGLISLSIALLNLLPLLPFDGGHIVFAVLEGVRGRSVKREIYERVSFVGFALVLLLFVIGLSNDLNRSS
jgi:regulator of sigma E protease